MVGTTNGTGKSCTFFYRIGEVWVGLFSFKVFVGFIRKVASESSLLHRKFGNRNVFDRTFPGPTEELNAPGFRVGVVDVVLGIDRVEKVLLKLLRLSVPGCLGIPHLGV